MNHLSTQVAPQAIDSREVAEMLEMNHKDILRKLEGGADRKGYIQILNENQMAPVDYFKESTYVDGKGETRKCYQFTKMGCEFIANKFTGEKGILFTAKYVKRFNLMEQGEVPQMNALSPQLQLLINIELQQKQQQQAIENMDKRIDGIKEVVALNPIDWRKDTANLINKMALKSGGYEHIKAIREESYELLNKRFGVALGIRLTNKKKTLSLNGVCKSKVDKCNYLDVIGDDKKLIEGYISIVKEMAIRYGACEKAS